MLQAEDSKKSLRRLKFEIPGYFKMPQHGSDRGVNAGSGVRYDLQGQGFRWCNNIRELQEHLAATRCLFLADSMSRTIAL
jgi:hypothetical protein